MLTWGIVQVTSGPSTSTEISTTSSVVLVSESASRREITHLTPQANLAVGHGKFEPSKSHENEPSNRPLHLPISKGQNLNLTKLYEPEDKPKEAIADILFVHGLTGNAYTTWLHKDKNGECYWPYELLKEDFPYTRILAFG
jgi:hypothetical protein